MRAFTTGGFADLRYVHDWNKGFVSNAANARYEKIARDIDKAMKFMAACGADFEAMKTTEFFAAHEALLLDYERPLVRTDSRTGELYSTSAHFLWVGERTRDLAGAHIDFVSRIRNPIGVKVSAGADVDDLLRMIDALDPTREPGRLTFITRMGAGRIREALPSIVEKVTASGAQVTWVCDPMHGNTFSSASGYKTRDFGTSSTKSVASSRCTRAWARCQVASTSSSPATTSPSASVARRRSWTRTSRTTTSPSATLGSTTSRASNSPSSSPRCSRVTEVVADLLSDTLTRPTAAMRHAMTEAEVGDDVFREDPTVRALEERVAGLLGHEAGLFCPTGSLANQLGLRLHVRPGGEMLADSLAHVVRAELGAAAVFSGITSRTWSSVAGRLVAADALAMVTTGVGPYQVETQLVVVENTHNFGGGTIQPLTEIEALRAGLEPLGVPMHLDGARLWNAHVATGWRWRHTAGCSTP